MKQIVDVINALIAELEKAVDLRVKAGWIGPGDTIPLITLLMHDSELRPIDMSGMLLYDLRFQVDIWHSSAKERDKVFDSILQHFDQNKDTFHSSYGWFDIRFMGITDVEEEGAHRKIILLRMRVMG
jgi:hypothetical protein